MTAKRTGVWLVGAYGGVATLTIVGARAIARGLARPTGLLTETGLFEGLSLPPLDQLVFGGHEVRDTDLHCAAHEFAERAGVIDKVLLHVLADDLRTIDKDIRPGWLLQPSEAVQRMAEGGKAKHAATPREAVDGIQADLRAFQQKHDLDEVVVINVSSTEPPVRLPIEYGRLEHFERALEQPADEAGLGAGVIHAYAAIDLGMPYVNFTPSPGSTIPAIVALAEARGVPHAGSDGKTGETLVKTALAPLFAGRALRVLSWEGYNMLGNRDGLVLDDPKARESKTLSKDKAVRQILGEETHSRVSIDYVPSLDDWKVAWDFIHFEGFLGARMSMQFTWQGNDSALAAPLVLDLARLAAYAKQQGETGLMPQLACYFKNPAGVEEQAFGRQLQLLEDWVKGHRATRARKSGEGSAG